MSKVLVVFGATGNQGASVISFVLNDPVLSKEFKIRALTRDVTKPAAESLRKKGVEVVQADVGDKSSLEPALKGSHSIFAVTTSVMDAETAYDVETTQGKAIADAAVAAGAELIIWSSEVSISKHSDGTIDHGVMFNAKADTEEYIRTLPIKSAFFAPGSFMPNLQTQTAPRPVGDGTYAIAHIFEPNQGLPWIDIVADTGKWVGAVLAEPDKYNGKFFAASTKVYSFQEVVDTISAVSGKTVTYKRIPDEVFKSFLPPHFANEFFAMFLFAREYGYYGKNQEERIQWAVENARGKVTTLEEYFKANPLKALE